MAEFCMSACFIHSGLDHGNFVSTDISQRSVLTQLRCGGIINKHFVANLLMNLPVKEFWKSVNIWRSYGQYYSGLLWSPYGIGQTIIFSSCRLFQRVSRLGSITARHLVVGVSQTLRRWTEGATCVRQGDHHVGHHHHHHHLIISKNSTFKPSNYGRPVE